jgi:hypothetical protein
MTDATALQHLLVNHEREAFGTLVLVVLWWVIVRPLLAMSAAVMHSAAAVTGNARATAEATERTAAMLIAERAGDRAMRGGAAPAPNPEEKPDGTA